MSGASPDAPLGAGGRAFQRLGRGIVRHPWYPILFWVVLFLVSLPLLAHLSDATQNSASNVPSSAPSSQASAELARLFPGASAPSSSLLLFTGTNITGLAGEGSVLAATSAISNDPKLTHIASVDSLYTGYQQFLVGETEMALAALAPALAGPLPTASVPSLDAPVLWGPASSFLHHWLSLEANRTSGSASQSNPPAYLQTAAELRLLPAPTNATELQILEAFYNGTAGAPWGFNGSSTFGGAGDCARSPANVTNCTTATARSTGLALLASTGGSGGAGSSRTVVDAALLSQLGLANFSDPAAQREVTVSLVAEASGVPGPWIARVWAEFPSPNASAASVSSWTRTVAEGPVAQYPLPIPFALERGFVSEDGAATLVFVTYDVDDSLTTAGGHEPIFDDVAEIDRVVPPAVRSAAPGGEVTFVQTGPAALDATENSVLARNLAIVLPLTLIILFAITLLYFRAPVAPLVTFGGLGIALGLGLAGLVGLSMIFGKVDSTAITLENTFVLGVGTDYSIFLAARYREELRKGADPAEAVVTAVTWAGQSIATSGGTAVLATLALAFSGVGLLAQWGETLSLAVLITVLVALTLVPAILALLGPRVFWPEVGERARRHAEAFAERHREERTYFFRAARLAQRRPHAVVGIILLASIPLVYVAVTAPLSYDFYQQLPDRPGASEGLTALSDHFGAGAAFPTELLATFRQPLMGPAGPNVTEFVDLSSLTDLLGATEGVASVDSPVGPYGATLSQWLSYGNATPAERAGLSAVLANFVGTDGATVLITVVPNASGLSAEAVALLSTLQGVVGGFASSHPELSAYRFGGGAASTSDLASQTALATQRMILAVSIGLMIVLFVVLRSVLIAPMAVATIGLSIGWAWGLTQLVFGRLFGLPLFFFVPTVLFILILGLGIDYNIFLLTRVREERLRGRSSREAAIQAVASTGGIITAAAVILAGAFAALTAGDFVLLKAIGFSVAAAVILDAMVVRTYLVPASLQLLGDRTWTLFPGRETGSTPGPSSPRAPGSDVGADPGAPDLS
jgi:RND superfamily putative drug exporter